MKRETKELWISSWKERLKHWAQEMEYNIAINKEKLADYSKEDLATIIYGLVRQNLCGHNGICDSKALSYNAIGIAVLADLGLFSISECFARRVIGKIVVGD